MSRTDHPQRIGVLLCAESAPKPSVQLLDTAAVDIFFVIKPEYLRMCGYPENVAAQGQEYEFLYIAEKDVGSKVALSAGLTCDVTVSLISDMENNHHLTQI